MEDKQVAPRFSGDNARGRFLQERVSGKLADSVTPLVATGRHFGP